MRHKKNVAKLDRSHSARQALWRSQLVGLIEHKSITTTAAKAKALRPVFEQFVTRAKTNTVSNRRLLATRLGSNAAAHTLLTEIAPKMADRKGGYTRIIRLATKRQGDSAKMAKLEIVL